jgi:hypothetical protein
MNSSVLASSAHDWLDVSIGFRCKILCQSRSWAKVNHDQRLALRL